MPKPAPLPLTPPLGSHPEQRSMSVRQATQLVYDALRSSLTGLAFWSAYTKEEN